MKGDLTIWAEGYRSWKRRLYDWDSPEPAFYAPGLRSEEGWMTQMNRVIKEVYADPVKAYLNSTPLMDSLGYSMFRLPLNDG